VTRAKKRKNKEKLGEETGELTVKGGSKVFFQKNGGKRIGEATWKIIH